MLRVIHSFIRVGPRIVIAKTIFKLFEELFYDDVGTGTICNTKAI